MTQFCEKVKNVQLSKTHSQTHAPAASSLKFISSMETRLHFGSCRSLEINYTQTLVRVSSSVAKLSWVRTFLKMASTAWWEMLLDRKYSWLTEVFRLTPSKNTWLPSIRVRVTLPRSAWALPVFVGFSSLLSVVASIKCDEATNPASASWVVWQLTNLWLSNCVKE